jgi:hypothetical protein
MGEFQTMLRKIVLACAAVATIAAFAMPTEVMAAKKRVVHERTFFRGQGWIWTGKDWTGVGMYPFGAWTDEGCWRHDRERPRWRGVWVCKPY